MNLIVLEYGGKRYDWKIKSTTLKWDEADAVDFIECLVEPKEDEK